MDKDTLMDPEVEIVDDDEVMELDDQGNEQSDGQDQEPPEDKQNNSGGNLKIALQQERKKRKEAQELLQTILRERMSQVRQNQQPSANDPVMEAISAMEGNEDQADIAKVLKAMYSKVSQPTESVMELQLDGLCEKYPGAADHKDDIITTAKRHGITVKEAYFMRFGEEAANTPKNDLLREAEIRRAAQQNSTARVDSNGDMPPEPAKKRTTIKMQRSEVENLRRLGITPQQHVAMQSVFERSVISSQQTGAKPGISIDQLRKIYGKEGGTKKG